jgi:hypothetical protein
MVPEHAIWHMLTHPHTASVFERISGMALSFINRGD